MERYSLCTRHQIINESVDTYVECLRVLAGECDFGDQVDKYIRDQLIISCSNKKAQEQRLRQRNPSLQETIQIAKSVQRSIISFNTINVDNISTGVAAINMKDSNTKNANFKGKPTTS